ncbi:MAG: type II CRISPR RNA-guided endonuclease Cas9 [Tannerellaceae bacterium]|jgi:CRISPR-associated endonuclease Csn1|nr:type II CRISPR RNA-guided endonuclease Cas9 [Tannerellaceae bacterium]
MKKVLGLDLGTSSIGWALVNEAENSEEASSIIKLGVRVIQYDNFVNTQTGKESKDPDKDFRSGKSISPNAGRTLKRSMRRNLQRYKLRRENLIEILKEHDFITNQSILSENGNRTTFETYKLRAKAANEKISLEEFARVLLMINKKRGYKSSRKAKSQEDGQLIDGMDIAKQLYNDNLTPGQLALQNLQKGNKEPVFYRSDLQTEFDKIWTKQKEFYPQILTDEVKEELWGKKRDAVWAICAKHFVWKETYAKWNHEEARNIEVEQEHKLVGIKREGKADDQKKENLEWRVKALSEKLTLDQLVICLQEINTKINTSSSYLGAISDRSKELYFNKQTAGQYLMTQLDKNPNMSLKNQVFYRQDYLDEFNIIWDKQAGYHKELTEELKQEIRDVVIFYQRRLRSQKGLISFCEFESKQIEMDGKKKLRTIGRRVIPRSSPLFQEFNIWQKLNDIEVFPINEKKKKYKPNASRLNQEQKELLFKELSIKEKLQKSQILSLLDLQEFDMNFSSIDGNRTQAELFKKYQEIIGLSEKEIDLKEPADKVITALTGVFSELGYNTDILRYSFPEEIQKTNKKGENIIVYEECEMFNLWHLLYSFEGDKSNTGDESLINKLMTDYNFDKPAASILAHVTFQNDYGSLSAKAIRKILPRMKEGEDYATACAYVYGKHSKNSLTTEELERKVYKERLENIPKNSLRNPVVEKILNQMINVINAIIDTYGKPDEIRIELARELKKSANERILLTENLKGNTEAIIKIQEILKTDFGLKNPSRNDIIRYKLWQELAPNSYKTLYSNTEISGKNLFSKEFDIEHIIPQSKLFDDSFSNKTLELRSINIDKGNKTAIDYIKEKYGESGLQDYIKRIISVYGTKTTTRVNKRTQRIETETKTFDSLKKEHVRSLKKKEQKDKWESLSDTEQDLIIIEKYYSGKLGKLVMSEKDLPDGFINRDLANTQYITKEAKRILGDLVKFVVSTTGSITERLREDWQLVDVMKEINFPKYEQLGLVEYEEHIDYETGEIRYVKKIKDWSKRNDHRHHAMDALTVAFTKRQFIQYLNNLNARRIDENMTVSNTEKEERDNFTITTEDVVLNTRDVLSIEKNYLERDKKNKLRFKPPIMPLAEFRTEAKRHLESILISIKTKNKVVTKNINTTKKNGSTNKKVQLTPRGQLHLETIYGSQKQPVVKEEKVGTTFNKDKILTVSKPAYRDALLKRLNENGGDPKKAFGSKNAPAKNPVFIDDAKTEKLPEKVKTLTFEIIYTIRKDISPDLKIEKVIDSKIKRILKTRLERYDGDSKKAFSNLDENPIWLNKEKGISIKKVTISGISNVESLHDKRDKDRNLLNMKNEPLKDENGNFIKDKKLIEKQKINPVNGTTQSIDFVNTGNNHHVAIYRDADGNLQEKVVSFFEAVARVNMNLPVIDKEYKHSEGWQFLFSMKQNEYFVFPNERTGFNPNETDLLDAEKYHIISPNLYRVQKIGTKDYTFRHHLETSVKDSASILSDVTWKRILSPKKLKEIVKVRINHTGKIVHIGE